MTKVAISGAAGRMGLRLIDLAYQDTAIELAAAIDSPQHPKFGQDAGAAAGIGEIGILLAETPATSVDAVVDFSSLEGAEKALDYCLAESCGLVMATTGLSDSFTKRLNDASSQIPIVWAPNMSLAVNLTMKLSEMAATALKGHGSGVDVEIIERHHRYKADSPSGTALKFGQLIADSMGKTEHCHGREGMIGQRPENEIGYHAVRTGDDPGQHTIVFGMLGETIELRVAASNRDCYASGALEAAKFLKDHGPGMYSMYDVLGLGDKT